MSSYKFSLSPGSKKWTCPRCGHKTFTPYINTETGKMLAPSVGRCDRGNSCGYHKPPREYFDEQRAMGRIINDDLTKGRVVEVQPKPRRICVLPPHIVEASRRKGEPCDLEAFLLTLFPAEAVESVFDAYRVGRTRKGDIIFWQISYDNQCRAGKIMKYNPVTGHRIKGEGLNVNWAHTILKKVGNIPQDWELTQCLFGEHLLAARPGEPIGIVESEKTALICALMFPTNVWLATGGCGGFNVAKCGHLRGRKVTIYPDADMPEKWTKKAAEIRAAGVYDISISNAYLSHLTKEQKAAGWDLADFIIEAKRRARQCRDNPSPVCHPAFAPLAEMLYDNVEAACVWDEFDFMPVHNPAILPMLFN